MRKFIGIFLGAMLAMACGFMAPAVAAETLPQLTAVHHAKAILVAVSTEATITASHATASASAERMSSAIDVRGSGDPDYQGPALAGHVSPDCNHAAMALREPGDDEGEGIGSDSVAQADPDYGDAADENDRMPLAA